MPVCIVVSGYREGSNGGFVRRMTLGLVLIAVIGLPGLGLAQWVRYPTPDVPKKADGTSNLTAPAPRLVTGFPGTGTRSRFWTVRPHRVRGT